MARFRMTGSVVAVLAMAGLVNAATISFSQPINAVPGGAPVVVDVLVTGGEAVSAADLQVILGGGQNPNLLVTNLEFLGKGVFLGTDASSPALVLGPGDLYRNATSASPRTAEGVLAQATIQVLAGVSTDQPIEFGFTGLLTAAGGEVPVTLVPGTVTIPEPASALLLLGALPFLRRRSA